MVSERNVQKAFQTCQLQNLSTKQPNAKRKASLPFLQRKNFALYRPQIQIPDSFDSLH